MQAPPRAEELPDRLAPEVVDRWGQVRLGPPPDVSRLPSTGQAGHVIRANPGSVSPLPKAVGPTYQIREDLAAYGGAFCLPLWGDYESTLTRWDLEGDDSFGVFAGLDRPVKEDPHWSVALQYAGATFAVATSLRWIFD